MESPILVGAFCVFLSIVASVAEVVLMRHGYGSNGVKLPLFVGLSMLKGAVYCGLCVFTTLFFQAKETGDNMAAVAIVLITPILLLLCTVIAAFAFGVTKLIPKTGKSVLPAAAVQTATLRVNISIVAAAVVLTTVVMFTG